ncbi:MAG: aromatic ring-hydroxylating dioxygenase subunit alpha [Candidatus Poseidoniaceae archaeon]|jgi:choline monooxygenase|nr:aromatic ring-hydroxylating dioxygenase subunit alpha [Candidatus Poseidoniaceae archaeon]
MPGELIDPDIRSARTLPAKYYTDEFEFQKILSAFKGWQFATHISDFKNNTIIPLDHIESINGESIVLIKEEEVKALSNVCTHRGMRLALEPCNRKKLHCTYHGRTFNLDGKLCHMPEFEQVTNFPSTSDDLPKYLLENWNGMYFVSQTEKETLPWNLLEKRLRFLEIESLVHDPLRDRDHPVNANWMLYVDNYLEGFHIPYVHPELNQSLDYSGYITEVFDGGVLQIGKAVEGDMKFDLPPEHPDYGEDIAAYYLWLFPNMMFNFYPWGMSLNIVIPISLSESRIIYRGYVKDPTLGEKGAGSILDIVEHQDQWIIELVQRGIQSSVYERGRYSPTREQGVHHFHRIISHHLEDKK